MPPTPDIKRTTSARAIEWALRLTVALQGLGNWRWMTQLEETPLLHWMLDPADIGGLAWSESTALMAQQTIGWSALVAAGTVLWRPSTFALVPLALLQSIMPVAMWRIADGYPLQAPFLPAELLLLFPFATQLVRVVAPVGLLLLTTRRRPSPGNEEYLRRVMLLLRWALAIVFVAHGLEALHHNPKFIDLLIQCNQRLLGISMSEEAAEICLTVVGALDVAVGIACVCVRSVAVMSWMTLWGILTAGSRIVAHGWDISWHQTLTRIPHFGVPLAVALWLHLLESEHVMGPAEEVVDDDEVKDRDSATETR